MTEPDEQSALSRRDFIRALGLSAGALFLAGCTPQLPDPELTSTPWPTPTLTPFQPSLPTRTPPPTETPSPTTTPWTWSLPTPSAAATQQDDKYAGRKLCFVLWDHQLARYNYRPRNPKRPVPQTCPLLTGVANRLTAAWEAYWKGILHVCNPG